MKICTISMEYFLFIFYLIMLYTIYRKGTIISKTDK